MQNRITPDSRVVVARDQVSCDLDGEAAVLNLATGIYYGLDRVGASIWQQIQTPAEVRSVCAALSAEYDVDSETAQSDLLQFLDEMMQEGLVELLPADA
ncbi:MAG: PqqD family peptide modification chaperone [Gemmatimonadota bacterium]